MRLHCHPDDPPLARHAKASGILCLQWQQLASIDSDAAVARTAVVYHMPFSLYFQTNFSPTRFFAALTVLLQEFPLFFILADLITSVGPLCAGRIGIKEVDLILLKKIKAQNAKRKHGKHNMI